MMMMMTIKDEKSIYIENIVSKSIGFASIFLIL